MKYIVYIFLMTLSTTGFCQKSLEKFNCISQCGIIKNKSLKMGDTVIYNGDMYVLSDLINSKTLYPRLTLAIIDKSCDNAYSSWLTLNKEKIETTDIKKYKFGRLSDEAAEIKIHMMKFNKNNPDTEYVVVIGSMDLFRFYIDLHNFSFKGSKLLTFGNESKKASIKYFSLFNKIIDVTHECK